MILICTSRTPVLHDPTNGDVPPQVALTFAADTFGLDPSAGPVPTASLSVTLDADETENFAVGGRYTLGLEAAPVPGTAAGAQDEPVNPPAGKAKTQS